MSTKPAPFSQWKVGRYWAEDASAPTYYRTKSGVPARDEHKKGGARAPPFEVVGLNSDRLRFLRYHAHLIVQHLHESAADVEAASTAKAQLSITEERHQRRVPGENADLPIVRRSHNGIGVAL